MDARCVECAGNGRLPALTRVAVHGLLNAGFAAVGAGIDNMRRRCDAVRRSRYALACATCRLGAPPDRAGGGRRGCAPTRTHGARSAAPLVEPHQGQPLVEQRPARAGCTVRARSWRRAAGGGQRDERRRPGCHTISALLARRPVRSARASGSVPRRTISTPCRPEARQLPGPARQLSRRQGCVDGAFYILAHAW